MTENMLLRIVAIAKVIADDAPPKRGQYVYRAGVRWDLIDELRRTLDVAGLEWRQRDVHRRAS